MLQDHDPDRLVKAIEGFLYAGTDAARAVTLVRDDTMPDDTVVLRLRLDRHETEFYRDIVLRRSTLDALLPAAVAMTGDILDRDAEYGP